MTVWAIKSNSPKMKKIAKVFSMPENPEFCFCSDVSSDIFIEKKLSAIDLSKTIDLLQITFVRRKTNSPSHPGRTIEIVTPDSKSVSDLYYPYRHYFL